MTRRAIADNRFTRSQAGIRMLHVLTPSRWWNFVFLAALVAINVWTLTIYRTTARDQATIAAQQSQRAGEIVANANAQFHSCKASIPTLRKLNGELLAINIIAVTLVANATANVGVTPVHDPTYLTKVRNLQRLMKAQDAAKLVHIPVPVVKATKKSTAAHQQSCVGLRKSLLAKK